MRPQGVILGVALVAGLGLGAAALGRANAAPSAQTPTHDDVAVLAAVGYGNDAPTGDAYGAVLGTERVPVIDDVAEASLPPLDLGDAPVEPPAGVRASLGTPPPGELAEPDSVSPPAGSPSPGTPSEDPAPDWPTPLELAVDPCAAEDGTPGTDCPEGVRTTVLAGIAAPDLWMFVFLDPPRWSEGEGEPPLAYCAPDVEVGPGQMAVDVVTNTPVDVVLAVRGAAEVPGSERTFTATTSSERATTWEEGLAAGSPYTDPWYRQHHCLVMDELEQGAGYAYRASVTDIFGRTAVAAGAFSSPDERREPPSRVIPVTDSRVFVSIPHRTNERVDIRAWPVAADATASCEPPAGAVQLWGSAPTTSEVSAEQLERRGHLPAFTYRTSQLIGVPEGSSVVVCLRWYTEGPSWDWDRPARARAVLLHSPDLLTPVISLEELDLHSPVADDSLRLTVGLGGLGCGFWRGPDEGTAITGVLCDPSTRPEWFASGIDQRARVDVTYAPPGRDPVTTSALLPTTLRCSGDCAVPETAWYRLPLPTVRVSSGLCGGGTGDCTPPTRENTLGSALLRLDFGTGAGTSGRTGWSTGEIVDALAPRTLPELPQLDTFATPRVSGPAGASLVSATLRADRPVTWSARWIGCTRTEESTAVAPLSTTANISLRDVCPGTEGGIEVTLTDAAGATTTWGPSRETYGEAYFWPRGIIGIPGVPVDLDVVLNVTPLPSIVVVDTVSVTVNGLHVDWPTTTPSCTDRNGFRREARGMDMNLPDTFTVVVTVAVRPADHWSGAGPDTCGAPDGGTLLVTFSSEVNRDPLRIGPSTVSVGEDAAFGVRLELSAR